ncbi:MAG: TetR/AcrR family transcriptional regulator [bacterium]|nr:TetR/AcrR family transcriptional regulator [bacterium]
MPPRKERKLHIRESLIIEMAARLIDQVGYTHLTMDMLSEQVGIAKATLYQHFKSKDAVMITAAMRALENLEGFMMTASGTTIEQLRSIMRFMMVSGYDADGFPTMIMHDEVLHIFSNQPAVAAKFQQVNTRLFALVDAAKAEGEIALDLPNEAIITMMMNTVQVARARTIYPAQPLDTLAEIVIRIFFNGLKPTI